MIDRLLRCKRCKSGDHPKDVPHRVRFTGEYAPMMLSSVRRVCVCRCPVQEVSK